MPIQMTDKTGVMRSPDDFLAAKEVIKKRLVSLEALKDPELMVHATTILEALDIAVAVSEKYHERKNQ